jgi:hypothetical protein
VGEFSIDELRQPRLQARVLIIIGKENVRRSLFIVEEVAVSPAGSGWCGVRRGHVRVGDRVPGVRA